MTSRRAASLALAALLAGPAIAGAQAPAEKVHRVEKLSDHAYAIFGKGGNIGLFVGAEEAVVVDSQFEPLVPELLAVIAGITDKPISYLVNTHHHPDHVSGNAALARKVTKGIIAHANVRRRMKDAQEKLEPVQRGGLPTVNLGDRDPAVPARLDLQLAGLELHLVHRSAAHTDSDVAIGYPPERVLHLGDLFFNGMLPFIDAKDGGGSFDGLVETITWFASWVPDAAKIIPGHGPVAGKKELVRYRDLLTALQQHARAHPARSSRELAASFDQAAYPEWKPNPSFVTWETLFDAVTGRGPGRVPRP